MIPPFLNSLAATVRDLVASGKAVHVNKETAAELDLLAGLPWNQAPLLVLNERITAPGEREVTARPSTPADLALGWLLASRALSQGQIWHDNAITCQEVLTSDRQRAAECAELAKEAAQLLVLERAAQIVPMPWTAATMGPYVAELRAAAIGTREGARAAWSFALERMTVLLNEPLRDNATRKQWAVALGTPPDWIAMNAKIRQVAPTIIDHYRRELEAM